MHLSKARYVALCQQLLAVACVLALATAAAGVLTLDIVGPAPDARTVVPAVTERDAYVATKPVAPKIREVVVKGMSRQMPRAGRRDATGVVTEQRALRHKSGSGALTSSTRPKGTTVRGAFRLVALSRPERARGLATVGVTWDLGDHFDEDQIRIAIRSRDQGVWSGWSALEYHLEESPSVGSPEIRTMRAGTEPTVVGYVQAVQMRVETTTGREPRAVKLNLIDPGAGKVRKAAPAIDTARLPSAGSTGVAGSTPLPSGSGSLALSAMKVAPKPSIYSRAQWGADEHIRDPGNPDYGTVKTGFVHHTVNANNYTKEQVPALIRGIYAYHVISKGWRDIGYNFLVDRFGRIWEGRFGGVDKAVVGAHTLGYNEVSFAMSSIGNFDIVEPPQVLLDAYAALFAWKLSLYDIGADATHLWVKDRYLNAINGHRDTGQTACPGRYLYAKIFSVRAAAEKIQTSGSSSVPPSPTVPPVGPVITPQPASQLPVSSNVVGSAEPDLLVRDKTTDEVKVVSLGGQFGFRAPVQTPGNWSAYDTIVAAGDLTGDRLGDLVVRSSTTGNSWILPGDGKGAFTEPVPKLRALATYTWVTGAGDFNRDGKADLVARAGDQLLLVPGNGRAGFGRPVVLSTNATWTQGYGAGDFNGDGSPDLVVRSTSNHLYLLPGLRSKVGTASVLPVPVTGANGIAAGGDYTGDGRPDLLVRRTATKLTEVWPGDGNGSVTSALGPFGMLRGLGSATGGNLLGRPGAEAIGYNTAGNLVVSSGNGLRNLGATVASGHRISAATHLLDVGDWDGDGFTDLGTRTGSDNMWIRRGDGTGTWWGRLRLMGTGFKEITTLAPVGDVTGDGHPDLVGSSRTGLMTVFPGNGKLGFKSVFRAPTRLRSFNQIGSGLWNATDAPGSLLLSAPDGSFVPFAGTSGSATLNRSAPAGSYDWVIGPGDVDGDRVPDLVVRERSSGDLWLLPGNGTGFGQRRFIGPGFENYDLGG